MFCGLSKTKRVVLADNLIQHFSLDEIDSVVAHEVGHCFYKHLWKSVSEA
jgi:STE24 endopeptidase